jgi:D-alanyl-D-alanine carboxypeptidase/D-alanyl-D-alanine-endopeptidase (penicillin-binding protein 4)
MRMMSRQKQNRLAMPELKRLTRAALPILLLLGACAGGAEPPRSVPLAATTAIPIPELRPEAGPATADFANQEFGAVTVDPVGQVSADLGSFKTAPALPLASYRVGTEVGYLLVDLESGLELAALNPDLPLIPASTVKLATAVVALDVLGPEHRFRTELLADGPVRGGVLEGDLILKGGGDPALDVADLLGLAVRLETSGIRRVEGRLVIDDTAIPRLSEIDPTQPAEAAYNPGIGALSVAFNRVRVSWRGGEEVEVATLPPLDEALFQAIAPSRLPPGGVELAGGEGDAVVWRIADRGRRHESTLPVKDPGLHAGNVFRRLALAQGIELPAPQRGTAPPDAQLLAIHESPPLRHLLRDMLLYSNNMMAEVIGLQAAARLGDASSGLDAAGALLLAHLARLMPEVDWRSALLTNGSGLDAAARLTPRQLAAIARYGWRTDALAALLPGGGWSGTLANRFDDPRHALRVWAKTGSVNYGSSLAGYLFTASGRPAVFVTMVSDIGARAEYDAVRRPGPRAQARARAWNARARALQDDLVETWLEPMLAS